VISFFGGDTLRELRYAFFQAELELKGGAGARVSPFITVQQAAALLQHAGFALPVVDHDCLTVIYPDLVSLMRQLRAMGETNALVERTKYFTPQSVFQKTEEIYKKFYGTECGGVRATFQVVTLTGWAPDACQQKPLKPGSAEKKLQDVL
jgi:hypothetical protein